MFLFEHTTMILCNQAMRLKRLHILHWIFGKLWRVSKHFTVFGPANEKASTVISTCRYCLVIVDQFQSMTLMH